MARLPVDRVRQGHPRRRVDAHSARAPARRAVLRRAAARPREPRGGRRHRRRHPGRRAHRGGPAAEHPAGAGARGAQVGPDRAGATMTSTMATRLPRDARASKKKARLARAGTRRRRRSRRRCRCPPGRRRRPPARRAPLKVTHKPLPASPDPAATIPQPVSYQDILRSTLPPEGPAPGATLPKAPVLVDVTPRALVVETVGGWCDVVVQRNAKIPCERTRAFTTSSDMQTVVRVRVAQGEERALRQEHLPRRGRAHRAARRPPGRGDHPGALRRRRERDAEGLRDRRGHGPRGACMLQLVGIAEAESVEVMQARHAGTRVG